MLAFVVFLNGMAIMILEMAGARLLAPELGTSIIVWTSLIGVILACLSLGYWLGGRLADNHMRFENGKNNKATSRVGADSCVTRPPKQAFAVLSNLFMLASVTATISVVAGGYAPAVFSRFFPLHLATVASALTLFALPSVLCGMISPYAIRLAITHSDTLPLPIATLPERS